MTPAAQAHITCHCGAIQLEGSSILAIDTFPSNEGVCHCNDCRYQTGGLYLEAFALKEPPAGEVLSKCTEYACSDKQKRYFCSTCGSFIFIVTVSSDSWAVGSGLVEQSPTSKANGETFTPNVMTLTHHFWVSDTRDYKLASRLLKVGGREVEVFDGDVEGTQPMAKEKVLELSASKDDALDQSEQLEARCHCGQVDFRISRPDWTGLPTSALPPEKHKRKLRATFCACRDCRLAGGCASAVPYAYVPPKYILTPDGKDVTFSEQGPSIPGLLNYQSTSGSAVRSVCRTCGARVFYWNTSRTQVVPIAVGILRAPEGAAASNWLWWQPRILWDGEATDQDVVKALQDQETLDRTQ